MTINEGAVVAAARAFISKRTEDYYASPQEYAMAMLEAATPYLLEAAARQTRSDNAHIEPGSGAYSSGFHYALDCIQAEDEEQL